MPFLTALTAVLLSTTPFDFYGNGPYDNGVPRPDSILRYEPGDKITTFRDQERVLTAIANHAGARVKVFDYGSSVEGRPLRVYAISSPENITRLDAIKKDHLEIAQGVADEATIKRTPPILWVNECIHGDEPASFESAMYLVYNLAASKSRPISDALKDEVVIVNPVYNPDGHERYAVYYDSLEVGSSDSDAFESIEPSAIYGRLNHYRFDMNRDRVAYSQAETRQEIAEFLRWNPQVYADQHGQVSSYFFPPNPMSINANVDRNRLNHWTELFGRATAKAFDSHGFDYFVKDEFDLYYPGYLDSFTCLSGAIGMTHETGAGKEINRLRSDGSLVTLREGIAKHFTSALALVDATAKNRSELMESYASFKKSACTGDFAGKFKRVVLVSADPRPLMRLQRQLARGGITSRWNKTSFSQTDSTDYWTGRRGVKSFPPSSLVVDMGQSQGPLAKALLEPGSDFEPEFVKAQRGKTSTAPEGEKYPGPEGAEFYDITGWSLPFAHQLKAWWCESAPPFEASESFDGEAKLGAAAGVSTVGYALEYTDVDDILAVYDALDQDLHGSVTTKPMKLAGRTFGRGTFLFLASHNDDDLRQKLNQIARTRHVTFIPLTSGYPEDDRYGPGSESLQALKKPSIAVVFGRGSDLAEVGAIWYLLERVFKLSFVPIAANVLNGDISRFTTIVVPTGAGVTASAKLRDWVSGGGSVIALGRPNWAIGASELADLSEIKGEPQSLPGSMFRALLDDRSFLSYGYPADESGWTEVAVPIGGSRFYQKRREGGSVVALDKSVTMPKLLSGWEYPNDTEKYLADTVWLQDSPIGEGHAILFMQDPSERAMWPGLYKMLLNAMLMGSG